MLEIHSLILGNPAGMLEVAGHVLSVSSSATFLRSLDDLLPQTESPQLILICQQWPDEYRPSQAAQLLNTFPLARIVVCYSSWCGSDGRTRNVWPLAVRVEMPQAIQRIDQEIEVLLGHKAPLPLTATYEEIFAFDHAS